MNTKNTTKEKLSSANSIGLRIRISLFTEIAEWISGRRMRLGGPCVNPSRLLDGSSCLFQRTERSGVVKELICDPNIGSFRFVGYSEVRRDESSLAWEADF
tara:strand:+ start:338 stop:640 length:303 start_codon:yes stop_codon:yes gene_type:complete